MRIGTLAQDRIYARLHPCGPLIGEGPQVTNEASPYFDGYNSSLQVAVKFLHYI